MALKTKYCIFNLQGHCKNGDTCNFAHSSDEYQGEPLDVYQQQQMIAILWTLNSEKDAKISELTDIVNASLNFNQSPEDDSSGNQDDAPPDDAPEPNATPTMDDVMSADKAWKKKGAKDVVHEFQECRYKCGFTLANKPRKKMYLHHTKCPLKKNKNTPAEE